MKTLILLLMPFLSLGQYATTWNDLNNMKTANQLTPGQVYLIVDLGKIEIVAKSNNTFYEKPFKRTLYAMDYDEEMFDFNTKVVTGIDNIHAIARCNGGGWFLLNDAGHKPYKVLSVSGSLVVHFTKTYDKVLGFSTSIDDSYSASNYNISCGASVGLATATIYFHKVENGSKILMTNAELNIAGSNIFINGKFSKNIQLSLP